LVKYIRENLWARVLIHILAWSALIVLPILLIGIFGRAFRYAPLHYILTCALLIPFYYFHYYRLVPDYLLNGKTLTYILILAGAILLFNFLPVWIGNLAPEGNLNIRFSGLRSSTRAKIRLVTYIMLLGVFAYGILRKLSEIENIKKELEIERTRSELAMLKSQINPHFLFNTINSIYYMALKKQKEAPEALITMSSMMRYILTDAEEEYVSLKLELEYIQKYIYFQRLRLPPNTTLNYAFRGKAENARIAPLILIPFIENAFKYGVSTHIPSTIDITIERKGEMLYMKVDNRKIVPEGEAEGTLVGIKNIKKRLALIYPDKHILDICDTEDSYGIELSLSLGDHESEKKGNEN